jgi:hemoglobin
MIEPTPFNSDKTPYECFGSDEAVRSLVDAFYDHMSQDSEFEGILALHPDDLSGSRDKLFMFLCGWLGGPQHYVKAYGHPKLRMRHAHVSIGEPERDQWLACMAKAMDDRGIDGELRSFLDQRFAHVADFMRNQG